MGRIKCFTDPGDKRRNLAGDCPPSCARACCPERTTFKFSRHCPSLILDHESTFVTPSKDSSILCILRGLYADPHSHLPTHIGRRSSPVSNDFISSAWPCPYSRTKWPHNITSGTRSRVYKTANKSLRSLFVTYIVLQHQAQFEQLNYCADSFLPDRFLHTTTKLPRPQRTVSIKHRQHGSHILETLRSTMGKEGNANFDGRS